FFLIGILAIIISRLSLKDASSSFVKGMSEMVVAALVVGFAKGVEVVLSDGQILDTIINSAANNLQNFHEFVAAGGMLVFQTTLNFFIPSGSGQAAVTMPIMAPLSDLLGITRQTAIFAFTCGDGFSNMIIPTSGILMAVLSLAKVPYTKWLKFILPLFMMLFVISIIFLIIAVMINY
ncbi:MAG: TIGR00366 family protein, partial [Ignavibacteria bacterium]|nr:TIGR00366 family protein [Ignavibacteria bacterium]